MTDHAKVMRETAEAYRRAIEHIESFADPITVEQLLEAHRIADTGGSEVDIRSRYLEAVDDRGPEGGPQLMRALFTAAMNGAAMNLESSLAAAEKKEKKWWQF